MPDWQDVCKTEQDERDFMVGSLPARPCEMNGNPSFQADRRHRTIFFFDRYF
jgi:hypothetical protein